MKSILILETMSPLHAGSETSLGLVDKPVQREKVTDFPVIYGSSLKGAIREFIEENDLTSEEKQKFYELFGPEGEGENNYASAITISDAKILLFPISSVKDIYTYITCPFVLKRFLNDCKILNEQVTIQMPDLNIDDNTVYINSGNSKIIVNNFVVLSEFQFNIKKDEKLDSLFSYLSQKIGADINKICIISDNNFKYFTKYYTEIMPRVKIGENGTTDTDKGGGNLWYEENIPIYTVFYSLINVFKNRNTDEKKTSNEELYKFFKQKFENLKTFIIGGNKTIGKGIVNTKFYYIENI